MWYSDIQRILKECTKMNTQNSYWVTQSFYDFVESPRLSIKGTTTHLVFVMQILTMWELSIIILRIHDNLHRKKLTCRMLNIETFKIKQ